MTTVDSASYTSDADWSPDGSFVVCSSAPSSGFIPHLTIATAVGRFVRHLVDTVQTGALAWSSANEIAFTYKQSNDSTYLGLIHPDGSDFHPIDSSGVVYNVDWSSDGGTLLYAVKPGVAAFDLYALTIATGHRGLLAHFQDNTVILSMRYSPDGSRVSYYSYLSPDQYNLYVINADGSNGQHIASLSTDGSWAPDSRHMTYVYYNTVYVKKVE